jgi:plasmid stabilization system protein ParE
MTTTGPRPRPGSGPEEARARVSNPRARALEASANPRAGAFDDDAVDGVARRDRRARVIACTFATVVIPRRAKVSRARASTGVDEKGASASRYPNARAREKARSSRKTRTRARSKGIEGIEGYDRRVVVI